MLMNKFWTKPQETVNFYDPLNFVKEVQKDGTAYVTIDSIDYGGTYELVLFREVVQHHIGENFPFVDYVVINTKDKSKSVIRCIPQDNGGFDVILLKLDDEMGSDNENYAGLMEALKEKEHDGTGVFVVQDDNNIIVEKYWRPNRLNIPHPASVEEYCIFQGGKKLLREYDMKIWDYSCNESHRQNPVFKHLFVQCRTDTLYVEIYKGIEISPERIS